MDVHKESISIAVMNDAGKIVMECVIEAKAIMILQCIDGLRGELQVTFEEGTWAAWLYDLLKPHVTKLVVCDPRKNALMKEGNKSDKIDARRLAELLRLNHLSPVYHGEHGLRSLKELVRSYLTITKDLRTGHVAGKRPSIAVWGFLAPASRSMHRAHRAEWLGKIGEPGVRRRAEFYYQQLDALTDGAPAGAAGSAGGKQETQGLETALPDPIDRPDSVRCTAGHSANPAPLPNQRGSYGPTADLASRQHSSADHRSVGGQLERVKKQISIRGLKPELQSRSEESV